MKAGETRAVQSRDPQCFVCTGLTIEPSSVKREADDVVSSAAR